MSSIALDHAGNDISLNGSRKPVCFITCLCDGDLLRKSLHDECCRKHPKSDGDETVLKCLAAYHVSDSERCSHCRRDATLFVLGAGTCFVKAKR